MNEQFLQEFEELKRQVEDLRFQLARKTGIGSADIKGKIVSPSSVGGTITVEDGSITVAKLATDAVTKVKVSNDAIGNNELDIEEITVNVAAGQTSGTGTATNGSIIIGFRHSGNCDQLIDSISISGTTITITLSAAATAQNNFVVILLKL